VRQNKLVLSKKEDEKLKNAPHSMILTKGDVGANVETLKNDFRKMFEPFTASKLEASKKNTLEDFTITGPQIGVTHVFVFTKTNKNVILKMTRLPRGPTLHFKVNEYTLSKDVVNSLKRPQTYEHQFKHAPLFIGNNFNIQDKSDGGKTPVHIDYTNPLRQVYAMLRNMLPQININELDMNRVNRCMLCNVSEDQQSIDLRHYSIKMRPVGISRKMRKLVHGKDIPNLNDKQDVAEWLEGADGSASESEAEPDEKSKVQLPQKMSGGGNLKGLKSAVRLTELGPRLNLELFKIDDDVFKGKVLYHKYIELSQAQKEQKEQAKLKKDMEKARRIKIQEDNIKKKNEQKALNKERSLQGMKRKQEEGANADQQPAKKQFERKGKKFGPLQDKSKKGGKKSFGGEGKVRKAKSFFRKSSKA